MPRPTVAAPAPRRNDEIYGSQHVCTPGRGHRRGAPDGERGGGGPPDSWTNLRVLNCDGGQVTTYLTPAGFGTPFHVVGSADVIVPKHVEVTTGGQTSVTLHVPGFDQTRSDAVRCSYVDPVGLAVSFVGLRS